MSHVDRELRKLLAIDHLIGDDTTKPEQLTYDTYYYYYYNLLVLALSRFKWDLPDGCNARFFEFSMLSEGMAVLLHDDMSDDYKTLRVNANGKYNDYGEPIRRLAYGYNGTTFRVNPTNSVMFYNNYLWRPVLSDLRMFAGRMAQLDRTIDVNTFNQRNPVVAYGSQENQLTLLNLFKSIAFGLPFIRLKKSFDKESIGTLDISSNYVSDKIYEMKTKIWNEVLQYLGIANMSVNKSERMITDEVQRSMGGSFAFRNTALITRLEGCEKVRKLFGVDINVKWNEDLNDVVEETGGAVVGEIHNATRNDSTRTENR